MLKVPIRKTYFGAVQLEHPFWWTSTLIARRSFLEKGPYWRVRSGGIQVVHQPTISNAKGVNHLVKLQSLYTSKADFLPWKSWKSDDFSFPSSASINRSLGKTQGFKPPPRHCGSYPSHEPTKLPCASRFLREREEKAAADVAERVNARSLGWMGIPYLGGSSQLVSS